jgi:hypothetical protein
MFRTTSACVLVFVTSVDAAPIPREEQCPPVTLGGCTWEGDSESGPTLYEFHKDGSMTLSYNGQTFPNCGSWRQNGTAIYWQTNNTFYEFDGTLTGTTVTGKAWNQPGGKWTLTFKRKSAPRAE